MQGPTTGNTGTYLRITMWAPKTSVSTSSDSTASMTPMRFRYASSASASPGACTGQKEDACEFETTHDPPLESECLKDPLHAFYQRVRFLVNQLAAFDVGAHGPVENKEGEEGELEETGEAEEDRPQLGIFALLPVCRVYEPDGGIYPHPERPLRAAAVVHEAIDGDGRE